MKVYSRCGGTSWRKWKAPKSAKVNSERRTWSCTTRSLGRSRRSQIGSSRASIPTKSHVLLAMASCRNDAENVRVTVRCKKRQGLTHYISVNRIFRDIGDQPTWGECGDSPLWLTDEANVAIFILTYLMSGCDFLSAIYNMPFNRMFAFAMKSVGDQFLFPKHVVVETGAEEGGKRWAVDVDGAMKLLAACCFHLHRRLFNASFTSVGESYHCDSIKGDKDKFVTKTSS